MDLVHPRTGKVSYLLSPPVVGFFEYSLMRARDSIPKKRMAEALRAYTHGDEAFAREALGRDTVIGRALVHETALSDDPLPDVLDWERATHVVGEARAWAVSLCYCRHKQEHLGQACDAPMDVCLTLNGGAEFVTRRGFGRAVERSEALDILAASREKGLVQIADNVQDRPTFVCNCCGCCCEQLQAANRWGLRAVNGSGFAPRSDAERCSGCSRCARACPVAAVEMVPARRAADRKNALAPRFDLDTCIGCGVCATACHKGALRHGAGRGAPPGAGELRREGGAAGARAQPARRAALRRRARGWATASSGRPPGPSRPFPRRSSCSPPSRSAPGSSGPPWPGSGRADPDPGALPHALPPDRAPRRPARRDRAGRSPGRAPRAGGVAPDGGGAPLHLAGSGRPATSSRSRSPTACSGAPRTPSTSTRSTRGSTASPGPPTRTRSSRSTARSTATGRWTCSSWSAPTRSTS